MGAMTSMMAPSCGSRGWAGGTLDWWPKARPPLWQYFSPLLHSRRVRCCPQRAWTLDSAAFLPAKRLLLAAAGRGRPLSWPLDTTAELGGEVYAPVVAVRVASAKANESIAVLRGRAHGCRNRRHRPS
jgi:hypothetical protein